MIGQLIQDNESLSFIYRFAVCAPFIYHFLLRPQKSESTSNESWFWTRFPKKKRKLPLSIRRIWRKSVAIGSWSGGKKVCIYIESSDQALTSYDRSARAGEIKRGKFKKITRGGQVQESSKRKQIVGFRRGIELNYLLGRRPKPTVSLRFYGRRIIYWPKRRRVVARRKKGFRPWTQIHWIKKI